MVWGGLLIAVAALKTPTRNGSNAQGVNLTFLRVAPETEGVDFLDASFWELAFYTILVLPILYGV